MLVPGSQTENAESTKLERGAPAIEKRVALQMMKGRMKKPKSAAATVVWRNKNSEKISRQATSSPSSARRGLAILNSATFKTRGTTRSTPIISPAHHIRAVEGNGTQLCDLVSTRTAGPIKALMPVPSAP